MSEGPFELTVIGGGIGGAASALRAAQYNIPTAWVLGDRKTAKASRSKWVLNVDNMIGVHAGIAVDALRKAWKGKTKLLEELERTPHFHIGTQQIVDNVHDRLEEYPGVVTKVPAAATSARRGDEGLFEIETADAEHPSIRSRNLILATGVMDRQPSIAKVRSDRLIDSAHWIYPFANRESVLYCIRCEGHLTRDTRAAVIGSSETAAQIVLMLAERYGSGCSILANGETVETGEKTRRLLEHHSIRVLHSRIVDAFEKEGTPRGRLRGFELEDGTTIEVDFAFVALGLHRVYNELARALGADLEESDRPDDLRHVCIDAKAETNVRGLFAVGDMATRPKGTVMKQVYTAQEYAVRAVDTVDRRRRARMRREILDKSQGP